MRYLFIVGVPRSGTTLLQSLLNRSSKVLIIPETHFYTNNLHEAENMHKLVDSYKDTLEFKSQPINHQKFNAKLIGSNIPVRSYLKHLINEVVGNGKPEIVGEKTPGHYMYIDEILTDFTECKIIVLVRDPRAICNSYKNVPWYKGDNITGVALRCRKFYKTLMRAREKHKENLLVIKYEDIISQQTVLLEKIASFIGISGLADIESKAPCQIKSMAGKHDQWQKEHIKKAGSQVNDKSINKWKKGLSNIEIYLIQKICSNYFVNMYEVMSFKKFTNIPVSSCCYAFRFFANNLSIIKSKIF